MTSDNVYVVCPLEHVHVCVFVCERERERVCVTSDNVYVVCPLEHVHVCVCVCVCVRERERERTCLMSDDVYVTPNLTPVSICGFDIPFFQSVTDVSFILDETLSMGVHIKYLFHILFCLLNTKTDKAKPALFSPLMLPTNSLLHTHKIRLLYFSTS